MDRQYLLVYAVNKVQQARSVLKVHQALKELMDNKGRVVHAVKKVQ